MSTRPALTQYSMTQSLIFAGPVDVAFEAEYPIPLHRSALPLPGRSLWRLGSWDWSSSSPAAPPSSRCSDVPQHAMPPSMSTIGSSTSRTPRCTSSTAAKDARWWFCRATMAMPPTSWRRSSRASPTTFARFSSIARAAAAASACATMPRSMRKRASSACRSGSWGPSSRCSSRIRGVRSPRSRSHFATPMIFPASCS